MSIYEIENSWTHVKEIPNTNLLISLHHSFEKSANMVVLDVAKKGAAKKIYALGEFFGCKF